MTVDDARNSIRASAAQDYQGKYSSTDEAAENASASTGGLPVLEVRDLSVRFIQRGVVTRAVDGVTYSLERGRTLAIVGESGSGKTVSSRALLGLLPKSATVTGSVLLEGTEIIGLNERKLQELRGTEISMVFQDPARSLNPTMRVGSHITEALRLHLPLTRKQAKARAIDLLRLVRIPSPESRFYDYPHQLSGGMRQRVMIAIALACHPKVLIADEATTALDVTTQAQIMTLLVELQQELEMTLVLITHDMGLAASFADEVLVMYAGRVVEQGPTVLLFDEMRMPYTKALLDAVPRLEHESHALLPIVPGRTPDLSSLPAGCAFQPRCRYAQEDCGVRRPPLEEHEDHHRWACFHPLVSTRESQA